VTVPSIVHLIGFPAAGKLTVARALVDAASTSADGGRFVVLDNHHINNVIFAALEVDGITPVPPTVWDRTREVCAVLRRTIEELSPRDWSFIFTNVLTDDRPIEREQVDLLAGLAARTGRRFLPVLLRCDAATLAGRVTNIDRRQRQKWIDPTGLTDYVHSHSLVDVADLDSLSIDTAVTEPAVAAALILERLT